MKFPGTGGLAYKEARSSVNSLGNEKRKISKGSELDKSGELEIKASVCEEKGDAREAESLREQAKACRAAINEKYNCKN